MQCPSLRDIYTLSTVPPTCDDPVFRFDIPENARLHVPAGTKEAYASAVVWCEFINILEDTDILGLHATEADDRYADAECYMLNGVKLNKSTLPGIYIVRKNGKTIVVKQ